MLTTMTERDWTIVLQVFEASRSRRGGKGRDDRKFLEALHYFVVEAVLTIEPNRYVRSLLRCARGDERDSASRPEFDSIVRAHVSAAGAKGGNIVRQLVARAVDFRPRFT
jgi:hypothetical protein